MQKLVGPYQKGLCVLFREREKIGKEYIKLRKCLSQFLYFYDTVLTL